MIFKGKKQVAIHVRQSTRHIQHKKVWISFCQMFIFVKEIRSTVKGIPHVITLIEWD